MKIKATKAVEVEAKTLRLCCKVCDQFTGRLLDQDGATLLQYEGYVPEFMPGEHYGNYLILNIDLDTGLITNWRVPSAKEIEEFIKDNTGDQDETDLC